MWKRRMARLVGTAVLVGALIGGTANPGFAELSRGDQVRIGELRQDYPKKYDRLSATIDSLSKDYNNIKNNLKKLKVKKGDSLTARFNQMNNLYKDLVILYQVWGRYQAVSRDYNLKLGSTNTAIKDLMDKLTGEILHLGEDTAKRLEKQKSLSAADIGCIKTLIGYLEEMNRKFYSGREIGLLLERFKVLLASEASKKFP